MLSGHICYCYVSRLGLALKKGEHAYHSLLLHISCSTTNNFFNIFQFLLIANGLYVCVCVRASKLRRVGNSCCACVSMPKVQRLDAAKIYVAFRWLESDVVAVIAAAAAAAAVLQVVDRCKCRNCILTTTYNTYVHRLVCAQLTVRGNSKSHMQR